MLKRPEELRRPVSIERIVYDEVGRPRIRDTVLVSDISFELGSEHLSDDDVLRRHSELDPADLDAVRALDTAPIEFDALIDRVVGPDPTHDDVLDAYLFLPRIKLSANPEGTPGGIRIRVRSSFEAAFTDAANVEP